MIADADMSHPINLGEKVNLIQMIVYVELVRHTLLAGGSL